MNCQVFEKVVIPLAHNQSIDADMREHGLLHAETCAYCALRLNEERMLIAGIHAAAAEIRLHNAPAHLETKLLTAFREQKSVVAPVAILLPREKRLWAGRQFQAIAAGILLLISAIAALWLQQSLAKHQPLESATLPPPQVAPEPQVPVPAPVSIVTAQPIVHRGTGPRPQKRLHHQAPENPVTEAETVTEFFPLSERDDLESLESGQIVRVELSGSALLAAGLPVDPAIVNEPVKADVLLGHDGQALAIRFVR